MRRGWKEVFEVVLKAIAELDHITIAMDARTIECDEVRFAIAHLGRAASAMWVYVIDEIMEDCKK